MGSAPLLIRVGAGLVLGAALALASVLLLGPREIRDPAPVEQVSARIVRPTTVRHHVPEPRTVAAYAGLGAWVDGFDYSPPYSTTGIPPLAPAELSAMAEAGVDTLYLQSGRLDDRSPDLLEDRWLLSEFLLRAHAHDIDVIAWYLPKWDDDSVDLDHLLAASEFSVLGHRFDGIAVDIEWNQDGLAVDERNRRFIQLSETLRARVGDDPVGAIVLPPVQTEVINPAFWPDFPWSEIADLYDVWLPMSYWSFRSDPYGDAYLYNEESVRRLRDNLGDPQAAVHAIGGIGAAVDAPSAGTEPFIAQIGQLEGFARSLVDTNAVGGSIYDWLTLDAAGRETMTELFTDGVAASLGG